MSNASIRLLALSLFFAAPACTAPSDAFSGAPAASQEGAREAAPATPRHDARAFYATTSIHGADFSPDGSRILVTSDASGIFNAWTVPTDGGAMVQLTRSTDDAVTAVAWFPRDERFLVSRDRGGNELDHLYVRETDGREVDLTPGDAVKASFAGWTRDGSAFFALTNERDPKFFDLWRYEVAEGYPRAKVFENPGGYQVAGVSDDGRLAVVEKRRNNADSDLYLVDLAAPAELVHLTPHEGDVSHGFADFAPDGSVVYFTSNAGSEFDRVWAHDVATKERKVAFEDAWDVVAYEFSDDGRFLVAAVNADARTRLRVFEVASGKELPLPPIGGLGGGDVRGIAFEDGGDRMAFYVTDDVSPANLCVASLRGGEPRRLTDARNPAIDPGDLVSAEVVRYPSFDGLAIPALLYKPRGASARDPAPALVWVHGGPGGQSRKGYNPTIQHLVNHGYAVLAVNNRGSSGYGKTFYHLDDRKHGDVDLKDCIHGRRYLEGLDWVDGERVGIIGGSYGGYMVCAALAFAPDAFDVGIDIFGVTNFVRTLESIPAWWADFRDALYAEMGDPVADRARLDAHSPLLHAKNIVRPLLVVQGANDPRVLQVESDEIVAAVRANGVPVEYLLFEDEGHGFEVKENRIEASEAYLKFLDAHLRGPRP